MKFNSDQIKRLILDAHKLLAQKDLGETSKRTLTECLKTIRGNEHLTAEQANEIESLIGS